MEDKSIVQEWLDGLKDLDVSVKKMFGCYCLYCDGQAVGWIHDSVMSLREVGLDYLPDDNLITLKPSGCPEQCRIQPL